MSGKIGFIDKINLGPSFVMDVSSPEAYSKQETQIVALTPPQRYKIDVNMIGLIDSYIKNDKNEKWENRFRDNRYISSIYVITLYLINLLNSDLSKIEKNKYYKTDECPEIEFQVFEEENKEIVATLSVNVRTSHGTYFKSTISSRNVLSEFFTIRQKILDNNLLGEKKPEEDKLSREVIDQIMKKVIKNRNMDPKPLPEKF